MLIRDVTQDDFDAILKLNMAEEINTSPMDEARLRMLDSFSEYHKVAEIEGEIAGFLLVMGVLCDYENENYEWFSTRYESFCYVDRIVINHTCQGQKVGSRLYEDLFEYARTNKLQYIACEYNLVPLNEPSRRFHDRFGFQEVGTQWLNDGKKKVSLQIARTNTFS